MTENSLENMSEIIETQQLIDEVPVQSLKGI